MELDSYNDDIKRLTNKDLKSIQKKQYYRDINNNNNSDSDDDDDIPTNLLIGIKRGQSSFDIDELKEQRKRKKNPRDWPDEIPHYQNMSKRNIIVDDDDDGSSDDVNLLIGIKRGQSSFDIDELKERRKRKKIPREDGRDWPDDFKGEGGYYEEPWRTEEEARREILESHSDYQFITLVAGAANTTVEQLFEEGDILAIFRREQSLMRQQRIALEEVKATTKDVERHVKNVTIELNELKHTKDSMKNELFEGDRLYSSLGIYDEEYQNDTEIFDHLKKKLNIINTYFINRFFLTDLSLEQLKNDLIIEGKRFEELKQLIKKVNKNESNSILNLTKAIINIWFRKDDGDNFLRYDKEKDIPKKQQILYDYLLKEIPNTKNSIEETENSLDENRRKILLEFFVTIFFLDNNRILIINKQDIYTLESPVPPGQEPEVVQKKYDDDLAFFLYKKYGGKTLKTNVDVDVNTQDYYTTYFSKIKEDVSVILNKFLPKEIAPRTPTVIEQKIIDMLEAPRFGGPYLNEINTFRAWLLLKISKLEEDIEKVENQLESSRDRLSRLRLGEITFKDIEQPYRHRRQWVERPEHSGIVRIKPIVVTAIDDAFKMIQLWTEYGKKVNVEFMQYDEEIRTDFAKLVAIKMSFSIMRFPKQYLSTTLRTFAKQDQYDIVNRLKNSYKIIIDQLLDDYI